MLGTNFKGYRTAFTTATYKDTCCEEKAVYCDFRLCRIDRFLNIKKIKQKRMINDDNNIPFVIIFY